MTAHILIIFYHYKQLKSVRPEGIVVLLNIGYVWYIEREWERENE